MQRKQRKKLWRIRPSWRTEWTRMQIETLLGDCSLFLRTWWNRRSRTATRQKFQRRHRRNHHHLLTEQTARRRTRRRRLRRDVDDCAAAAGGVEFELQLLSCLSPLMEFESGSSGPHFGSCGFRVDKTGREREGELLSWWVFGCSG